MSRAVRIVVRIQAGGRDEDEASTGAGGMSRAVREDSGEDTGGGATTSDDERRPALVV